MAFEAMHELEIYETTSDSSKVFNKIRSVGIACLDGQKLSSSIKEDIPIREQLRFQSAVFATATLSSLSGGKGNNSSIRDHLGTIHSICIKLQVNAASQKSTSLFYSWQSSLPNNTNRGAIKDCLERSLKEINSALQIESRITLDSDTSNTPGSPDIIHTILSKIDSSSFFVADVSLVNGVLPNPNVMFELGYAIKSLGDKRVIMIFNEAYGSIKDLPFDLGFKRQIIYHLSEDSEDRPAAKKALTQKLTTAIRLMSAETTEEK